MTICLYVVNYKITSVYNSQTNMTLRNQDIMDAGLWDRYNNIKTILETRTLDYVYGETPRYKRMINDFIVRNGGKIERLPNGNTRHKPFILDLVDMYDVFIQHYSSK